MQNYRVEGAGSSSLFPRMQDWSEQTHVCGFFNLPEKNETWETPQELKRFIDDGPPPVYMTFGSLSAFEPQSEDVTGILVEAAKLSGCPAIIQENWDKIRSIPESLDIFRISHAPHNHIFPRCAAIVHHGGAGTTQSATIAGCPSVIVVHASDQLFWGTNPIQVGSCPKTPLPPLTDSQKTG